MIDRMALTSNHFLSCFPRSSLGWQEMQLQYMCLSAGTNLPGSGRIPGPGFREDPGPALGTHGCFTTCAGGADPWTRGGSSVTAQHYLILLVWRRSAQSPVFWESYCKCPGLRVLLFLKYSLPSIFWCPKQEEELMCNLSGIRCCHLSQGICTYARTARAWPRRCEEYFMLYPFSRRGTA